jgi:PAS domain S-box-containing protein
MNWSEIMDFPLEGGSQPISELLASSPSAHAPAPALGPAATLEEANRLLRESQERFLALVMATAQLVWTTPPDGLVEDMPLWRAYTGQTVEQVRGWGWLDAVHPDDQERVRAVWASAVAARTMYQAEYRLRRHDGEYRYFLVRAVPVLDAAGELREWVGVHTDITERHRLEEAQRRLAQEAATRANELETVIEAMADGVAVYDSTGRMRRVNTAGRQIFGFDALPPEYATLPMGEREQMLKLLNERGEALDGANWPITRLLRGETLRGATALDLVRRLPDGSEVFINLSGAPLRDTEGRVMGVVAIARDVTERRLLERRLQETLDALLAMAETLVRPEPAEATTREGLPTQEYDVARRLAELTCRVLGCRRVGITILDPQTQIMRPLTVVGLAPEQERQWWAEQRQQQARLGEGIAPELMARFLAGEPLVLDMTAPPYDTLPNPYGVTTVLAAPMRIADALVGALTLDYSGERHQFTREETLLAGAVAKLAALVVERERLLREAAAAEANTLALLESNRRMDEFLSMASHEMKNPVAGIKLNVQLAARRLEAGAEGVRRARDLLERTERQLARLSRLVEDLLDVSRIQAGKLEMRPEACDLAAIMREAVAEQRQAWPGRVISLVGVPKRPVPIHADADRIGQVVTNFLTNALRYSSEEKPVEVRLSMRDGVARVAVRDQGPGLPEEEHERIWERFHRAAGVEAVSGGGGGLGLGLHISKTIVAWHGGQVGVESEVGTGSTFWCALPLRQAEERPL